MAEYQDAEDTPFKELTPSLAEPLPAELHPASLLVSNKKGDPIKQQQQQQLETAPQHSESGVEHGCVDISLKSPSLPSRQISVESGFTLENSVTSSLELHVPPSSDISQISKEKHENIPSQPKDGSTQESEFSISAFVDTAALSIGQVSSIQSPDVINSPNEMEILPHQLQDSHRAESADFSDAQRSKTQILVDSTATAIMEAAPLPSEEHHSSSSPDSGDASMIMNNNMPSKIEDGSPARVTDSQMDKHSTVEEISKIEDRLPLLNGHQHNHVEAKNKQTKSLESAFSTKNVKKVTECRGFVDTTTPFESVKEAVTKFGGIIDWKAHKALTIEKHKHLQHELEKVQIEIPLYIKESENAEIAKVEALKELDTSKKLVEELKLNLERAQTAEAQARQDAELAQLRAKEMEDGITDEASVAAKTQLEVAKSRHEVAVAELKSVGEELAALQRQYTSLVGERDVAMRRAEEAASASKEMEKAVEDLTLELIATKESLESAHSAHLEAEEHRIGAALAKDQDCLNWDKEIKQAEEELHMLNEQLLQAKNLEANLETASCLLVDLKKELAAYMESKLKEQSESIDEKEQKNDLNEAKVFQLALVLKGKELEEVKANIEKAKKEVSILRVAESSLKLELAREKAGLASMRQREGMASIAVSSVEAEIERTKEEIKQAREREKEAREKMIELPKLLQQAALEADGFKSSAKIVREGLRKVSEDAEQAKATLITAEIRMKATLKEIEASKASERLTLSAVKALQESEAAAATGESPRGVTLPLEEYYTLSKGAHEAEEIANERITSAIAQIQVAKESELKILQRLEEAYREMDQRKEALKIATEKANKAREGKLGVEQELRKWRAEHEQRRRVADGGQSAANPPRSPEKNFEYRKEAAAVAADVIHPTPGPMIYMPGNKKEHVIPGFKPRKKKSFFPRIVLFFVKKRAHSRK